MTNKYTQAVIELLLAGAAVDAVLSGLQRSLKKNRHEKLYPKILREVAKAFAGRAGATTSVVTLAKSTDEKTYEREITEALARLGVENTKYDVRIDETIIGGHIVNTKDKRIDQSYKNALLRLYRSIVEHT